MRLGYRVIAAGIVSLCLATYVDMCLASAPTALVNAKYQVYTADISGDGCPDYLFKSPNVIVMLPLDDDSDFPVSVPSPDKPVMLVSNGSCSNYVSQVPTFQQSIDPRWQPASYAPLVGDVVGDGSGSILVAPTSATGTMAFNLTRSSASGNFALIQTIAVQGFNIGAGGAISLEYANSDSRSDMVVRNGAQVAAVFTAGTNGMFSTGGSDLVALATVIWGNFVNSLANGNANSALQVISSTSLPIFQAQLSSAQAAPTQFAQSVISFDVTDISTSGVIQAAIVLNINGQNDLFYVLFEVDSDGYWKIYSM